ncbi:MAG: hypothetical protein ACRDTJ_10450, partial [Pseudonocardiaceae bacterium]
MSTAPLEEVTDGSSYVRVIDALAAQGLIVGTPGDTQAYSRCPAHDDHTPSLSVTWKVNRRGGGETFVFCQRHCDRHDVLAAVGLVDADRYDTPPAPSFRGRSDVSPKTRRGSKRDGSVTDTRSAGVSDNRDGGGSAATVAAAVSDTDTAADTNDANAAAPATPSRLELVATYTYTDVDGVRVYDIRRWRNGTAKYSVRSYDTSGARVVAKKAPAAARRVLYNLPAVAAAEVVWLCEGEKDADSVAAALQEAPGGSEAATTAPFGAADTPGRAGAVWLPQHTAALEGKTVRIIADRDVAGYRHALHLAETLSPVTASVEVVEPLEGNDATDHLAAGRGLAELVAVTREVLVTRAAVTDRQTAAITDTATDTTVPAVTPGSDRPDTANDRGGRVLPLRRDSDKPGGSGSDNGGRGGGGGGGGSDEPIRRTVILRDEFTAREDGLFKIKREHGENRAGDKTVTELLTELLSVRVRMTGRVAEDLRDGSRASVTHVDLVADKAGETHELRAVELDTWESCRWVADLPWQATFTATSSGRSMLRNAIISTSGAVPVTTMYGVLGWQEIDGRWVYLHAGGGIDANGPADDIRVSVPEPLAPFDLPAPPSTLEELRDAVMASVSLFEVVPGRVAAPLLGSAYRACLGWSRVTVMPFGPKGSGKTGVAAFAAQHYAPSARHDRMPGAGAGEDTGGTVTALEELRYRAGDMILPLDDLAPDRGTERASQRAALIARSQFNRQAKLRGTRTGGLRPAHPPRSLPLVTGEETTTVESAESRIVTLKVGRGDVNIEDLALFDENGDPMQRARLVASLVRHYAPMKPTLDEWLRETRSKLAREMADPAPADPGLDARHSESVADLAAGWRAMLDMSIKRGALTEAEAAELWAKAWAGLVETKRHLMAGAARRTPSDRARELLRTLLMQRRASLRAPDDVAAPERAALCGWEPDSGVASGWRERGEAIGWTDGDTVWLNPGAAHAAMTAQGVREGDPLTYTGRGLAEALADAEVIRSEDRKGIRRTSVQRRIGSMRPRVWELSWSWLFGDDEDPD